MPVSLDKIRATAPNLVKLAGKAQFAASKHGLDGQTARVALALDYSGSATSLYSTGAMQRAAERILAVATAFDDDGTIDVFLFDSTADHVGELTLSDYTGGIDRLTRGRRMGSTDYADAIETIVEHYGFTGAAARTGLFRRPKPTPTGDRSTPVYVAFLTDGEPDSRTAAAAALTAAADHPVFFQTVGLGRASFGFLESLDTLPGRRVDNAGFFTAPDITAMPDAQLLDALLGEFPAYLTAARTAGVLT